MKESNILPAQFAGMRVRIIKQEGDENLWIPTIDIKDALGIERTSINKIIKRNQEIFEETSADIMSAEVIAQKGKFHIQKRKLICVNYTGLVALLLKIAPSRVKNPDAYKKIVEFQKWAIQTIAEILHGNLLVLHADLNDLLFIKSTIRSKIIQQKANEEKLSPSAIYERLRKYKRALGIPRSNIRSDKGRPKHPDGLIECEKIKDYLKDHKNAPARTIKKSLNLTYSEGSIRRIKRELKGNK
jgi:predicted transcriptional regulator